MALVIIVGLVAGAQEPSVVAPQAIAPGTSKPLVPLRLLLTLARYQGDKRISSAPYTLWVTANQPGKTTLRMGVEVPLQSGPTLNYRNVGTEIDCSAEVRANGLYKLAVSVNDSSVTFLNRDVAKIRETPEPAHPSFRSFHSTFNILLSDGQSAQYVTATDPVSGEVTKIDLTLHVVK
jgi:hypothetical protein